MIYIEYIMQFIQILPTIFSYLAPGYVFIAIFGYITGRDGKVELNHVVFRGIVGSFIIKTVFDLIFRLPVGQLWNTVILIAFAAILAYVAGRFFYSPLYDKVRLFLGIERTFTKGIWINIFKEPAWYVIGTDDPNVNYYGYVTLWEENEREPIVVLSNYQILDKNYDVVHDLQDRLDIRLILKIKDFSKIEQILPNQSKPENTED